MVVWLWWLCGCTKFSHARPSQCHPNSLTIRHFSMLPCLSPQNRLDCCLSKNAGWNNISPRFKPARCGLSGERKVKKENSSEVRKRWQQQFGAEKSLAAVELSCKSRHNQYTRLWPAAYFTPYLANAGKPESSPSIYIYIQTRTVQVCVGRRCLRSETYLQIYCSPGQPP